MGCGTGNYSAAMLKYGVGKISLVDASQGMLEKARGKLDENKDRIGDIKEAVLPFLPFDDGTFDAAMINQVMHHLGDSPDGESFPAIQETFKEMHRVLKPGGVVVITNTLKTQYHGHWFCNLFPDVLEKFKMQVPSTDSVNKMLRIAGFRTGTPVSYLGNDWFEGFSDVEGPLSEEWRMRHSVFSFASKEELNKGLEFLKSMKASGTLQSFYDKHDGTSTTGTFILFSASKKQ
ncbi:hypothetical protein FSP39_024484 [Pinctada imbricata]|uniref:Methyltransferase type 11 domain-containing protein n=1 Tax=Pinctada imbricata TaxID=66713 RepID=A0AA88XM83_PINIB|nr:hypothetical protein FSP39_024484 [Pinctada imbricata]